MKKFNTTKSGLLAVLLGTGLATAAQAQDSPRVLINGQELETRVQPITENNRVLVPLRAIFEQLGAQVDYNRSTGVIVARRGRTDVEMQVGSRDAQVNGRQVFLDVPATAYSGRTLVPLRFVSEALGAQVDFSAYNNLVTITDRRGHRPNRPVDVDGRPDDWRDRDRDRIPNSTDRDIDGDRVPNRTDRFPRDPDRS